MKPNSLYIVATPIGNLDDITLRALDVLREVDYVVSEDTRVTNKLLDHFEIGAQQLTYRDENKHKAIPEILSFLNQGKSLALVTDSGTPLISDPGFKLVSAVIKKGYEVIPIPGASAVTASLISSGLPTDKFSFVGFLPRTKSKRKDILEKHGNLDSTLIIYESPYRVEKLLNEVKEVLGNRQVALVKELTKLHEQKFYGTVEELLTNFKNINLKGEFTVLIAKEGFRNE